MYSYTFHALNPADFSITDIRYFLAYNVDHINNLDTTGRNLMTGYSHLNPHYRRRWWRHALTELGLSLGQTLNHITITLIPYVWVHTERQIGPTFRYLQTFQIYTLSTSDKSDN